MRRREFIVLVCNALAASSAAAQQRAMPVVGLLAAPSEASYKKYLDALRRGLKEAGYIEGENVVIEYRWADGQYDRLPAMAADLVARRVAAIAIVGGVPAAMAAKAVTATIPIVFAIADDPVRLGLVSSFSEPGGNATGVSFLAVELERKRLEIIREAIPRARSFAIMMNPNNPQNPTQLISIEAAASELGLPLNILNASSDAEIESAYQRAKDQQIDALIIGADTYLFSRREQLVRLSARHSIPTIYPYQDACELGGLISYGTDLADGYRIEGDYLGRILKGEMPGSLPVQQSAKVNLIINLKTAKEIGVTFPVTLLGRADEVIE